MNTTIKNTKGLKSVKINFPEIGVQELSADGTVDVQHAHVAHALVQGTDWEFFKVADEEDEEGVESEGGFVPLTKALDNMNLEQLMEIGTKANVKNLQKFAKNEKALRAYLKTQLK